MTTFLAAGKEFILYCELIADSLKHYHPTSYIKRS